MLISIVQRGADAHSLSKHLRLDPEKVTGMELPFGRVIAFFPVHSENTVDFTLLLEVAPERLPREAPYLGSGHPLQAFVHARAYTTSALMSVAIGRTLRKVMDHEMPAADLEILVAAVDSPMDAATFEAWFSPLGYAVKVDQPIHNIEFPESGRSHCKDVHLKCHLPVATVLKHLEVLLCALDEDHVHWIGRETTLSIANTASAWLEFHPESEAIQAALLRMPYSTQRNSRGSLVEPHDEFFPPPKPALYRTAAERTSLNEVILATIQERECKSAMVVMPEDDELCALLAQLDLITRVALIDLQAEYLQEIAQTLNQSILPIEAKRKISLVPASPLYQNDYFTDFDAIVLEGVLDKLPTHQWPAMEATFIRHCKPKLIIAVQMMGKDFKSWVNRVAKEYLLESEILIPKLSEPIKGTPLGIAIFTLKEGH